MILENKIAKILNFNHSQKLHPLKISTYMVVFLALYIIKCHLHVVCTKKIYIAMVTVLVFIAMATEAI